MAKLRVATINVGSFFEANWDDRKFEVVAWLDKVDADVVCLQEVWQDIDAVNTATWVAERSSINYHSFFGGHPIAWKEREKPDFRFGSAILSRWPIDVSHAWALPIADNPEDPIVGTMPWELVHAHTGGLDVYTAHLAAAPVHGRHRRVQVMKIDDLIKETRGDRDEFLDYPAPRQHMPAILTGDFNAEPESDEMRWLRGHTVINDRTTFFQDAWRVAGDGGPGITQDWRTHPLSANLNVHRKRIDYVYVGDPFMRAGDAGRILNAELIADSPLTGIQASDHMGLLVEIVWPQRPSD